jgi:hypothetical protein
MTYKQLYDIILKSIVWTTETPIDDLVVAIAWPRLRRIAIVDLRDIGLRIFDVMVVNGGEYRSSSLEVQDFTEGGNHNRWPDCRKNELWIDDDTAPDEIVPTILHEGSEVFGMERLGLEYEKAHATWANQVERIYRENLIDNNSKGKTA